METIVTSTSSFGTNSPRILEVLHEKGFRVVINSAQRKLSEEELRAYLFEYEPIGLLAGTEPITRSILEAAKGYLRVISRVGVGWDNVDRQAAEELEIKVYRTEGVLEQAVSELTLGMILSALRAIPFHSMQVCQSVWKKGMGRLLQEKIVGVIGFGAIGQRVGELLKAFGARVMYYDPAPVEVPWAKAVLLCDMLPQADIITIHAGGSEQILGEYELNSLCKQGVIVVNTARGGLVGEKALHKALALGRVSFACLDVFEEEPYRGPLTEFENVILTPHIGSYAREARIEMERMAVDNLLKGLASDAYRPTLTL